MPGKLRTVEICSLQIILVYLAANFALIGVKSMCTNKVAGDFLFKSCLTFRYVTLFAFALFFLVWFGNMGEEITLWFIRQKF